jgi:hypothetical protein
MEKPLMYKVQTMQIVKEKERKKERKQAYFSNRK